MQIIGYTPERKEEWDAFVRTSRNGTFLLLRDYMDYHADRFTDCSLMFYREGKLMALLPANLRKEEQTIYSHQGLTYGGLIVGENITTLRVLELFEKLEKWLKDELGIHRMVYKVIPYIYHRCPAEEDLYALFRRCAKLRSRAVASVIEQSHKIAMRKGRKSTIKQARKSGISIAESEDFVAFWELLSKLLSDKYATKPVHSLEEITRLKALFPQEIHLFIATSEEGKLLGGSIVYEFENMIHAQYIAASPEGKEMGAIDLLYAYLIDERYADKRYIDFGTSVEQGGWMVNEGLLRQKEAFGARAVVYDTYEWEFA